MPAPSHDGRLPAAVLPAGPAGASGLEGLDARTDAKAGRAKDRHNGLDFIVGNVGVGQRNRIVSHGRIPECACGPQIASGPGWSDMLKKPDMLVVGRLKRLQPTTAWPGLSETTPNSCHIHSSARTYAKHIL